MGDAEYKRKHKKLGLCVDCSEKAAPKTIRCPDHYYSHLKALRKYNAKNKDKINQAVRELRKKYIKEGRCTGCSAPLRFEDKGHERCVNCRGRVYAIN